MGQSLAQHVPHFKADARGPRRPQSMVFKALILCAHDAAQHHQFNVRFQQVRNFVGDGLAGGSPVHVEGVGQDQPALTS